MLDGCSKANGTQDGHSVQFANRWTPQIVDVEPNILCYFDCVKIPLKNFSYGTRFITVRFVEHKKHMLTSGIIEMIPDTLT